MAGLAAAGKFFEGFVVFMTGVALPLLSAEFHIGAAEHGGIRLRPENDRLGDGTAMGDVLGYARVSTRDQDVAGQTMRLEHAGAIRVFTDVRSGKSMDRPGLTDLLAYARKGDTLAVVRLDRLGRYLAELLTVVEQLKGRGVALLS